MNIQMIGIDHSMAAVEYREKFSFTKTRGTEAMQRLTGLDGVNGCVLLSTCNRMELYISTAEQCGIDLYQTVCDIKQQPAEQYRGLFVSREGQDAAAHLFSLTAGMESRIVGEDQILMQVKEALTQARDCDCTDKVLEVLFRMAITTAKKVKTEITFSKANSSATQQALLQLQRQGYDFAEAPCMVIGNGEMGKLTALALKELGADVTVTVRQYRSGVVQIPEGCKRINYGDRYSLIPDCAFVVSATASPNLTLEKEQLEQLSLRNRIVFLDLAVPRDIDPRIAELPQAALFDIDCFQIDKQSQETRQQLEQADRLLQEGLQEFSAWYACKDFVPLIQKISRAAAADVDWRMGKAFHEMQLEEAQQDKLERSLTSSSAKVFSKLLFQLRDTVSTEVLRECLEAMGAAYPEVLS